MGCNGRGRTSYTTIGPLCTIKGQDSLLPCFSCLHMSQSTAYAYSSVYGIEQSNCLCCPRCTAVLYSRLYKCLSLQQRRIARVLSVTVHVRISASAFRGLLFLLQLTELTRVKSKSHRGVALRTIYFSEIRAESVARSSPLATAMPCASMFWH